MKKEVIRKTNEQMFRSLFKDLSPIEMALLRERIVKIMKMTKQSIEKDSSKFDNPIISHSVYIGLDNKVNKHLGFKE